ncbi:unnamed protein product [Rotaria sp. Silwood1]|nr:unnamed protein product [Rotaria sp. Silwood1]
MDKQQIELALFDTADLEDYNLLRQLSYPNTHVVLICFSVDNPVSLVNVTKKWIPEVRVHCNQCPVILVACEKPVTTEIGKRIATQIKADSYMKYSAKTCEYVQDLFIQAVRLSLRNHSHRKSRQNCVLC